MTSPCAALWTCRWLDLRGYERPFPADDFNLNEVRLGRKVKNSQARKPHQRGMGGRGTDDDDTHERQTDTNRLNIVNDQTTPLSPSPVRRAAPRYATSAPAHATRPFRRSFPVVAKARPRATSASGSTAATTASRCSRFAEDSRNSSTNTYGYDGRLWRLFSWPLPPVRARRALVGRRAREAGGQPAPRAVRPGSGTTEMGVHDPRQRYDRDGRCSSPP